MVYAPNVGRILPQSTIVYNLVQCVWLTHMFFFGIHNLKTASCNWFCSHQRVSLSAESVGWPRCTRWSAPGYRRSVLERKAPQHNLKSVVATFRFVLYLFCFSCCLFLLLVFWFCFCFFDSCFFFASFSFVFFGGVLFFGVLCSGCLCFFFSRFFPPF